MAHKSGEDFLSALLEPPVEETRGLQLLRPQESRHRQFWGTLAYVLRPKTGPTLDTTFWPDVFVPSRLPWVTFLESLVYHALAIVALLIWGQWQPRHITRQDPFRDTRVVVYPVQPRIETADPLNNPLPKLDTGNAGPHRAQTGDPAYARQPILSVPREPDNRAQTIVTPPDIVLRRDVRMPNIVAWSALPLAPAPAIPVMASERSVIAPQLAVVMPAPQVDVLHRSGPTLPQATVVAPPPDVQASLRNQPSLTTSVVPPPPQVNSAPSRLGTMNLAHAEAIAPAPQLPVSEQRFPSQAASWQAGQALAPGAVPPPPSISSGTTAGSGRVIALSVNPAAPAQPLEPPPGNRRGEFSATPQGNRRGSGQPAISESAKDNGGTTGSPATVPGLPPGIRIGEPITPADSGPQSVASITIDRHPIASIPPPRVNTANRKPATLSERTPTETERNVFGLRRFYQMTLNMPNLNSAGGSWIIRFAELKAGSSQGELFSPLITVKADPAYPSELQRENVQGTVTLYAIIHSDGSVRDIRVLDGADDRLDQYAREALARCRFEPALKNGVPVALEAVVAIPFRARKAF